MLRVLNYTARLIVGACRFDYMMPILRDLHLLPIQDPAMYRCLHKLTAWATQVLQPYENVPNG